jgi:general secretion pathway protein K
MKIPAANARAGIALIIVMIAVVSLTILAGGFAYSMKVETRLAMNANYDVQMEWLGRSGVEKAKYVLGLQMSVPNEPYDALNQIWAGGPGSAAVSNSPLAAISLKGGEEEPFDIEIVDLERKININAATEPVLQAAFLGLGVDAGAHNALIGAIRDWIDPDDLEQPEGAESAYYETLDPPYLAKNGPLDDLSELLFIRGITPELYFGLEREEQPAGRLGFGRQGQLGFLAPSAGVALTEVFTPLSAGRVNVNTAPASVLQILPFMDERIAAEIIRLRAGPDGADGTEDDIPFRNVGELVNAGIPPQIVQQIAPFLDVRSRTFEVRVTARIGNYTRKYYAVVGRRDPRNIETLVFRAE